MLCVIKTLATVFLYMASLLVGSSVKVKCLHIFINQIKANSFCVGVVENIAQRSYIKSAAKDSTMQVKILFMLSALFLQFPVTVKYWKYLLWYNMIFDMSFRFLVKI